MNVMNAKINAIEGDSTWGIRAVEGVQKIVIEATSNTRDLGSLFLYHSTWVIFVEIVRNTSKKFWDSLTTAVKILTAKKVVVVIQEERWCHSKAFLTAVRKVSAS